MIFVLKKESEKKFDHQDLHAHQRFLSLLPGLSHRCLERNALRLFGFDFLIFILASPKRKIFSLPFSQAFTTNFLTPAPGSPLRILRGLLQGIFDLSASSRSSSTRSWKFNIQWIGECFERREMRG